MLRAISFCIALSLTGCAATELPQLPEMISGRCRYTNSFSKGDECRDYLGDWASEAMSKDCADWEGELTEGAACGISERLGYCVLTGDDGLFTRVTFPGSDTGKCGSSRTGCEVFGGGKFVAAEACGGTPDDLGLDGLPVFLQPRLNCVEPKAGEAPGLSANGQVCTWEAISGATEKGRYFADYASCDRVRTQRPYSPVSPAPGWDAPDARLSDPLYVAELNWVKDEIRSTACVCCHSTIAPNGPSQWFLEAGPNFMNSFKPTGLAMGAGWINTVGFGAYPKEQNNGFSRATPDRPHDSIFVTTDPARIAAFFERELSHRGLVKEDFANVRYGAGPLDIQREFRPEACEAGVGVSADGTVNWIGGSARYVYVLEASAISPTVPPNLDLPTGTLWRIDVPENGTPVTTGAIRYGDVPSGMSQRFPATGAPSALVSGNTYYLYVLQDVIIPITRCLFTAP